MELKLTEQETKILVEMLTMSGYVLTQVDDAALSKAEKMHELIQKLYHQAKETAMPESFDKDEESQMIFPNAEVMSGTEDSPLYLLKSYNEYAAADVLSQQLGLRDAAEKYGVPEQSEEGAMNPEFVDEFIHKQTEYLEEFSKNGFSNVKVTRIHLS